MRGHLLLCATCLALAAAPAGAQITIPSSSADWILDGGAALARLGITAAPAGDVNDDGYDDVLIATTEAIGLYTGSAAGLATVPSWSFGPAGSGWFLRGFPMGDVNGDGFDDVLIGDPGHDVPSADAGRVLLFLGSASGLSPGPVWLFAGDRPGGILGLFAGGGDIDGDGFDDVTVLERDRIRLFRGSATGPETAPSWTIPSPSESVFFNGFPSNSLAIQDLDADGFADLAYTSVEFRGSSVTGRLFVHRGSPPGLDLAREIELDYSRGEFVAAAYPAGDVNGDGRGDILLGFYSSGPGAHPEPGLNEPESVWVFKGSRSVLRPAGQVLLDGIISNTLVQTGAAGDLNGDGYGDLIVAESYHPLVGPSHERLQVFTGNRRRPGEIPAAIIVPDQPGDLVLHWPATGRAGDVNGDGYDDLIVGVPGYSGAASQEGRVYLFHGRPSLLGGGGSGRIEIDPGVRLR